MPEPRGRHDNPLSHALFRTARMHKARAAQLLRPAGLRPGQELVLMTLWRDGPQRMVDLAQTLDSDAPTVTRSIARLEKSGLVTRHLSPDDRRAVIIAASESSHELRPAVETAWARLEASTADALTAEQRRELLRLLSLVETALSATDDA